MKKFLFSSLLGLLVLLFPTFADAAPGCVFYWSPQTLFFQSGGSVQVIHTNGTEYTIYAGNVVSGAQYSLADGDTVFVSPPDCHVWGWGWTYFCPCNRQGGVTCGPAQSQSVGSAVYVQLSAWESCNCPNGSSAGGLHFVYQKYCQAPPP